LIQTIIQALTISSNNPQTKTTKHSIKNTASVTGKQKQEMSLSHKNSLDSTNQNISTTLHASSFHPNNPTCPNPNPIPQQTQTTTFHKNSPHHIFHAKKKSHSNHIQSFFSHQYNPNTRQSQQNHVPNPLHTIPQKTIRQQLRHQHNLIRKQT